MRKLWIMLLCALMAATFTACGTDSGKAAPKAENNIGQKSASNAKTKDTLVVYFSCSGNTKKLAETTADALNADIYEITPAKAYSAEDLNYHDESTRATVEQKDDKARPKLKDKNANIASYKTIVIAYPIWWGMAPRIIDTFVESYDFSGKTIVPVCTSGGSDIGQSGDYLKTITKGFVNWKDGKKFSSNASKEEIKSWFDGLGIK